MGKILCTLLLLAITVARGPEAPSVGTVYVVLAVDTETGSLAPYDSLPELDLTDFETSGNVGVMMTDTGRAPFRDSYGLLPKLTWFVLTHEAYVAAGRGTAVLRALQKYRPAMDRFGDAIGWHYHNCDWRSSPVGGAWRQLTTFSGVSTVHGTDIELAEQILRLPQAAGAMIGEIIHRPFLSASSRLKHIIPVLIQSSNASSWKSAGSAYMGRCLRWRP